MKSQPKTVRKPVVAITNYLWRIKDFALVPTKVFDTPDTYRWVWLEHFANCELLVKGFPVDSKLRFRTQISESTFEKYAKDQENFDTIRDDYAPVPERHEGSGSRIG